MLSTTTTIIMNKVICHIYYIYITSHLFKKRFGYKSFAINLYFNPSQYYPTLNKTLAIKVSLHLICFIIRLYSCNINPNLWLLFFILLINVTVLWSVNTTNGYFHKAIFLSKSLRDLPQCVHKPIQNDQNLEIIK